MLEGSHLLISVSHASHCAACASFSALVVASSFFATSRA
jgi:hypothetical protein